MSNPLSVTLFCPQCGQKLSLPTVDLRQHFRCPRCHAEASAADLIPPQRTLAAVPIESVRPSTGAPPSPSTNFVAQHPAPPPLPPHPPVQTPLQSPQALPVQLPVDSNLFPSSAPPLPLPSPSPAAPFWSAPQQVRPTGAEQSAVVPVASSPVPTGQIAAGADLEEFGRGERVLESGRASWPLRAARAVLDLAERFDAFTYGHRLTILNVLAGVYCITVLLSVIVEQLVWEKLTLSLFSFVLVIYGLAHLSMFRTEDDRWTWRTALQGLRGGWSRTLDWLRDYRELPSEAKMDTLAKLSAMTGFLAIAVRAAVVWVIEPKDSIVFTTWAFAGWVAIAFGLYQLYTLRKLRKGRPALPSPSPAGAVVRTASSNLPAVIDLVRNGAAELQRARIEYGDYLADLLAVLATWNPKPRGVPIEADYQASLHRHLRKQKPGLKVEREKPIRIHVEGTRRRIDLAIDDCIVIEMKRYIRRTSEADRTFQQVRAYATEWKDKGPVLLVLCETAPGFAHVLDLQGKIAELRANNYNVVAVAAGRASA